MLGRSGDRDIGTRIKNEGRLRSSSRAGLVFPVSRIRRLLKGVDPSGIRVSKTSAVFLAATL